MKRRLFNLLAAVSLVLCVATAAAWAWSYWVADAVYWTAPTRQSGVGFDNTLGKIVFFRSWFISGADQLGPPGLHHYAMPPHGTGPVAGHIQIYWRLLGFFVNLTRTRQESATGVSIVRTFMIAVPTWFPVLILTVPPIIWLKRYRERRRPLGRCTQCGYDLRATPERCPECGMAAASASTAVPPAGLGEAEGS